MRILAIFAPAIVALTVSASTAPKPTQPSPDPYPQCSAGQNCGCLVGPVPKEPCLK